MIPEDTPLQIDSYTLNVYNKPMKFKELGLQIKTEREKRSWEQAELAKRMSVTQQTVSRWEKGGSRPKPDDLSRLLDLFSGDRYEWSTKAGYDFEEPDTSLSPYLPLSNLSAENFELFCRDLVQALNHDSDVYRYGPSGYKQDGIDLCAQKFGLNLDYQCKRHKQFGPAAVNSAVKKTTLKAKHHYLLLSRTATTLARKAIQKHRNWTLWDKEDISAKVRTLPLDDAIRLVDTYFPGKRKSFLGVDEPSPWLTTEEFYLPFVDRSKLFSHGWGLVGRSGELEQLTEFMNQSDSWVILLSGRGGIGKSRLLKAWAESIGKTATIRFVSSGSEINAASLESLPMGPAILVIDDAHDRTDIPLILNGVARIRPDMKVIISTRPYGIPRLKEEISKSGLSYETEKTISLDDLAFEDAKTLAEKILTDPSINGNMQYATRIAEITKDCPFATVVGSHLVGKGAINPELLKTDQKFREELLNRFRDVVTGDVGGTNAEDIRDLLDLLALVQPFNPSDPQFAKSAEDILGKPFDKILRNINLLEDSGVLLRRGRRLRIVPDLLSDYIRSSVTFDEKNQRPTGYANRVFEKVRGEMTVNLLVNISQLDWRLSASGTRASLLDDVWLSIKAQFKKENIFERAAILDVVKKVSYYQPSQALDLVRLALSEQIEETGVEPGAQSLSKPSYSVVVGKIPSVLRYAAYDFNYLPDALDILKELAEKDTRPTNPHPDHPLRVLQDLASFEPGKPIAYNEAIAATAIRWLEQPSTDSFSPFDVLDVFLNTEGHQSQSKGFTLTMTPFKVLPDAVFELRKRILDAAFRVVYQRPLNEAVRALETLTHALSYPIGILGQDISIAEREAWDPSILSVLEGLKDVVANPKIDPYITVEVRKSVSWHATWGSERTKAKAKEVLNSIPETLDHQVSRAIVDSWGWTFETDGRSFSEGEAALIEWRRGLADGLVKQFQGKFPDLIKYLESRIITLNATKISRQSDAGPFLGSIMEASPEFSIFLGQYLLSTPTSPLINWFGSVITVMAKHDRAASLTLARDALKNNEPIYARSVSWALGWGCHNFEVVPEEIELLKAIASSTDPLVRRNIVRAVRRFPKERRSVALGILLSIDISDSVEVADEVLGEFEERYGTFGTEDLTSDQLEKLMNSLVNFPSIESNHIYLFFRKTSLAHPALTLKMLMNRVEHKEADENAEAYDPLPVSWRHREGLRFHETAQYEQLLRTVRDWNTKPRGNWIRPYFGRNLFKFVSSGFDEATVKVIEEWASSGDEHNLEAAAALVSEANSNFVWDNTEFVVNILERAHQYGSSCYKRVCSSLLASVHQGVRARTPGQPYQEDIVERNRSTEMMSKLPIGTPAYKFYKMVHEAAIAGIERETYDEDELADMDD